MLSKCANPACTNLFLYLHQGQLYRMDSSGHEPVSSPFRGNAHRVEFFWLCDECAANMTVTFEKGRGLVVQPFGSMPSAASPSPAQDVSTSRLSRSSESAASRLTSECHPAAG